MKVLHPLNGETLDLAYPVRFEGTFDDPRTVRIMLKVDSQFALPDAALDLEGKRWALTRAFIGAGHRHVDITGRDSIGNATEYAAAGFDLVISELNGYQPPPQSRDLLGTIPNLLETARQVTETFVSGGRNVFTLPDGQLYFDGPLNLDDDGSRYACQDPDGQSETSLTEPGNKPVDADAVPYFVLPGGFYKQFGIRLGNIAAVIFQEKLAYAVFADTGPAGKLGEGSIALHRALGHEPVHNGRLIDSAINGNVVTIVFPGSGDGTAQTPGAIDRIGHELLESLGGNPPPLNLGA